MNSGCLVCAIEKVSGSNNHNWKGGSSYLPYPPQFNRRLKEYIRKRDNYICQLCNRTEVEHIQKYGIKLHINHIDFDKNNCSISNLNTLCISCNSKINYNREYYTKYFQDKLIVACN